MEEAEEDDEQVTLTTQKQRPWAPPSKPSAPSLWRRSLDLGKKFAVAGAAITSAPVVLPPLLVGLAFAIPFGVYLAGYAYTDGVMRALLSPDEIEGYDVEIEMWPPSTEGAVEDRYQSLYAAVDDKAITLLAEEGESKERREDEKGIAEMEDIEKDERDDSGEHKIKMWPPSTEPEIQYGVDGEVKILRSNEKSAYMGEGTTIQDRGKAEHSSFTAPSDSESAVVLPLSLSTEYTSEVEDQSSDAAGVETEPAVVSWTRTGVYSDEAPYTEEIIWEQINAMRTIVGYKTALHSTPVEELKALYLFTGVEPPASLTDTPDPGEVGDKLQFLKSVIGVK